MPQGLAMHLPNTNNLTEHIIGLAMRVHTRMARISHTVAGCWRGKDQASTRESVRQAG